jgi:hypothetical protein
MFQKIIHWLGIAMIIQIGLIHFYMAPQEFVEARYIGILFVLNFAVALIAALKILSRDGWGWVIGLLVAIASITGYTLSRTVGLPGMEVEVWSTPMGMISLAVEMVFLVTFVLAQPWKRLPVMAPGLTTLTPPPARPLWSKAVLPVVSLLLVAAISLTAYRLDLRYLTAGMVKTVLISEKTLEEQYGLRIIQVGNTMLDGIVDMRLRIVDASKAAPLLGDPNRMPSLQVEGQDVMIMAARMSHHTHLIKTGGTLVVFFPNPHTMVHKGTQVSLVFGDLRVEPIVTR